MGDEVSKFVRLLDSEVLQRWAATVATIGFPLLVLPSRVGQAVEHPTVWNWVVVVVIVAGIVSFATDAVAMWRKHLARGTRPDHMSVVPVDVSAFDVELAIASTTDRISAIKALREQHRGLGLKAAADLVDVALDVRGE